MIALGLVMLSLALVLAPRRIGTAPKPVPLHKPSAAEPQQFSRAEHARRSALHPPRAPRVHLILLAGIEAESNPGRRNEALQRAVESVSDAILPSMLDSLALDASPGAAEMSLLLVRRLAESDAPAAAAWILQLPDSPVCRDALEQVAIAWANTDLPAAAIWVHAMAEGDSKQAATLDIAYEAARTKPLAALELVSELLPTWQRDDLLIHAVSQWAETDSTTATTWAMEVADPALRQRLVACVAIVLAEQDAAAAVALAVNGLVAGDGQDRATVSIVQRWVQLSPQAAASWVAQFPDIPSRDAAVRSLLALWTTQDAVAAGDWIRGLPVGAMRDLGMAAYAQALADASRPPAVVLTAGGM